jgi:pyruvate dehydrogenase E1 component alpha subunit
MHSVAVDGNDVMLVKEAAAEALMRARAGAGPTFLECRTYRHSGHSRTDPAKYRPAAEVEAWLARDPLLMFERILLERGINEPQELEQIKAKVLEEVVAASREAEAAEWPIAADYLGCAMVRT